MMKLQFNPNLDFQHEAINAVVGLFEGQEICRTTFTVASLRQMDDLFEGTEQTDLGIGNRRRLLDEDIHDNVKAIQLRNGLVPSETLDSLDFTVEMETGTGKTYVYLRTIFEINRLYGFTKFIIVVPSIAIKEGVYKSLQMTEEHFKGLYDNVQFDYFVYDSQKLGQVLGFATSNYIQIMVINIDSFRREREDTANIIHQPRDRMAGSRPIEFIQATNPIVIIDEPQSVDTTEKSKDAIASLNPLCMLRYSATHVDRRHMIYKLDSVDAYERKLVKQIEVAGIEVRDSHNKAYIKLLKVDNRRSPIRAQVEIDIQSSGGSVQRKKKTVYAGNDLLDLSGRSVYEGYIIEDIYCERGNEYISFTSQPEIVRLNQAIGEVNDGEYKRLQIRKTIEEHLDKEMRLRPQGIKVLSLFFIDRVANYRQYDDDGNPQPGKYALMFEEEYKRAIEKPRYRALLEGVDPDTVVKDVHAGYFAIDRRKDASGDGILKESRGAGTAQADESAYQLIMRDKERLLSFDSRLRFIFSHSALKEGWDNPNVFQICTLNETASVLKKRQEIGRGLRIAVNQDGERVHGFEVNRLTVIANESYEDFAHQLQNEIEQEEGIRFGVVEPHLFAQIPVPAEDHETGYLGVDTSRKVWDHLKESGYIDDQGRVQDSLRADLKNEEVELPEEFRDCSVQITAVLRKVAGNLNIKNADDRKQVKLNKAVFLGQDFKDLWDRIKYRTSFRVEFDSEKLIEKCVEEIKKSPAISRAKFITRTARLDVNRGGVQAKAVSESAAIYEARDYNLPDVLGYLQNETNLTRRTLVEIMKRSDRLEDFKKNPQKYMEQVSEIIKRQMRLFIADGIVYRKLGDQHFFAQELFEKNELYGYLRKNMLESSKSVFDHVVYDSNVEEGFAQWLNVRDDVKVYAKLPGWFKIDTPLGSYNPDWAVLFEEDDHERLYFVVESKGSLDPDALRPTEKAKITCGIKHFEALGTDVRFITDRSGEVLSSEARSGSASPEGEG